MCGIFGIAWHKNDSIPELSRLQKTAELLSHRGPDSYGIHRGTGIGLIHTRLSLVDLSSNSNQPFWDKHQRYCLVYNGEIYNFQQLRAELEYQGIKFKTTSDTEVLLELLLHYGVEATLPKLEGMFAFALYDTLEKTLILTRDRFGIKPLFICDLDDTFIFASEIKAMMPWLELKPDILSISSYLQGFGGSTQGYSFFENIQYLPPGNLVKLKVGDKNTVEYNQFFSMSELWDLEQAQKLSHLKPEEIVNQVEQLLFDSVNQQMYADATVGALCSGGVDSSIIMAMAAQSHNNLAIFHANVLGPNSEYQAAAKLAKHLKLDLMTVEVRDRDFIDLLPETIWHYGQPFYPNTPHSIPFLMVSKLVSTHNVKAVLSGEGSDECYLGYKGLAPNILDWRQKIQTILSRINRALAKQKQLISLSFANSRDLVMELHNRFEIGLEAQEIRRRIQGNHNQNNYWQLKSIELLNYNLRALLHRNDSMGMAASIESRFPFLNTELVKFALNLPYDCKIRRSITAFSEKNHPFYRDKWVIRQIADRYLPKELSQREKKPFPVNAFERFQISSKYFDNSFVADLFGLSGRENSYLIEKANRELKLRLMQLEVWTQIYLHNLPQESAINKLQDCIKINNLN